MRQKSKQCNGCWKGSDINGLDMMAEAKWDSYLEWQRDLTEQMKER